MRLFISIFLGISTLSALPKNPIVLDGKANFDWSEKLVVEVMDRTVIDCSDFSVEENELVRFILPSAQSTVLVKVSNNCSSRILGKIESNGCVVLMNQVGILIGEKGIIDVRAFYATTLNIADSILLNWGELRAKEKMQGMIVNQGIVRAGVVCLLGFEVRNQGAIEAEKAALVGAQEAIVFLDPFHIQTANLTSNVYEALWTTPTEDRSCFPPIPSVYPLNMPGPTVIEEGAIRGGFILLLADYIEIKRRSVLDASGEIGGSIWIGGGCGLSDWKGARIVRIDGTLKADGRRAGKILACSDGAIRFYGSITARGIENEGSIGLLGKIYVDYKGIVESLYFEESNIDNIGNGN